MTRSRSSSRTRRAQSGVPEATETPAPTDSPEVHENGVEPDEGTDYPVSLAYRSRNGAAFLEGSLRAIGEFLSLVCAPLIRDRVVADPLQADQIRSDLDLDLNQ